MRMYGNYYFSKRKFFITCARKNWSFTQKLLYEEVFLSYISFLETINHIEYKKDWKRQKLKSRFNDNGKKLMKIAICI